MTKVFVILDVSFETETQNIGAAVDALTVLVERLDPGLTVYRPVRYNLEAMEAAAELRRRGS